MHESLQEALAGSAHDLQVSGALAIRRFLALAHGGRADHLNRLLADCPGLDLTAALRDTAPPIFLSAGTLGDSVLTALPPDCSGTVILAEGEKARILVSNRLGLGDCASHCLYLYAAALANRLARQGDSTDTPLLIHALATAAGATGLACNWRFAAVRDCGVVRHGFALVPENPGVLVS